MIYKYVSKTILITINVSRSVNVNISNLEQFTNKLKSS